MREIDRLWHADSPADVAERDALVTLVDAYERKRWPIEDTLDPIDVIEHAMTPDAGHTRQELVGMLGSASIVSEVLARKRPLTLDMIRAVAERWAIPVALLTPAYGLEREIA